MSATNSNEKEVLLLSEEEFVDSDEDPEYKITEEDERDERNDLKHDVPVRNKRVNFPTFSFFLQYCI